MTKSLPSTASVATSAGGAKLHAPAAERNKNVLVDLLVSVAPQAGNALEIASGTGQHCTAFAHAMPQLTWQPTEIDPARRASIDAYAAHTSCTNLEPACELDASTVDWHKDFADQSLIVVVNLLHLVGEAAARNTLQEAMLALKEGGQFVIYGPFKRNGALTSEGDARFHAQLNEADADIGYKNDVDIEHWLKQAGAHQVVRREMPANNLCFIATR